MDAVTNSPNHYIRTAIVFLACLGGVFLWPYLAWALHLDLLFFAPQLLFPYDALVREGDYSRLVLSVPVARLLDVGQWAAAGILFVWFGRRLSVLHAVVFAIGAIVAVGIATQLIFWMIGVSVSLDGP